jgi:type I restriction enzyme S subunit
MLTPGDLFVSLKGATKDGKMIGSVARVPPSVPSGRLTQDTVKLEFHSADKARISSYLYWLLRTPQYRAYCEARSMGSAVVSLSRDDFLDYPVPPFTETREGIVEVLEFIDDKIELNRRMNATLEAMARALFQSWFVDFDPVRAKLDGREPFGLDPDIAALFPDAFQDSELCRTPNGWTLGRVDDVSDFSRSSICPGGFPDETFDHYSLPAFDGGRTPKAEFGVAIMSNKLVVARDSILLSKLNPHIPRIWLPDLHATRRSVCSTEFIVATPRVGYSREFLFSLFTSAAFASSYCTLVTGTTGSHQRIRPESVLDMNTVIPPPHLVEVFTAVAKPMFDRINRNIDQSRILATLRDTLLPRLLSGEIRPSDN